VHEQDVKPGTVKVLHSGEVDDETAALRGGLAECVAEAVSVAHVGLADSGHDGGTVGPAPGGKLEPGGHGVILAYISTVVPAGPGSILTCCTRARISAMPRPR
jgi:hypothetical protein